MKSKKSFICESCLQKNGSCYPMSEAEAVLHKDVNLDHEIVNANAEDLDVS